MRHAPMRPPRSPAGSDEEGSGARDKGGQTAFAQNPKCFPPNMHGEFTPITPCWPGLAPHSWLWDPICFALGASSSNVDSGNHPYLVGRWTAAGLQLRGAALPVHLYAALIRLWHCVCFANHVQVHKTFV
eukprot:359811-Chlamydomonas_euryale.AAC.1